VTGFPVGDLAYGAFSTGADGDVRLGASLGEAIVDLRAAAAGGALGDEGELVRGRVLNPLLSAGRTAWSALRAALHALVTSPDRVRPFLVEAAGAELHLPFVVGDYVDFYSSLEHATNLGRILRPDDPPLLANWRHLPVGYHGRSGTVAVSGTPVRRPWGQLGADTFGPTAMLDLELEVGFVTGDGPPLGTPIDVADAEDHVFGLVLVNDWSARDLQRWEYQPLGPFLGKSFLTSVSPWVVPLDALGAWRVDGPRQEPEPLPYLRAPEPRGLDLHLEVHLRTAAMAARGEDPARISSTSFAGMYWSMAQQLAHLTVNGATVRAGDLCASGTVSGSTPGSEGSLMELTWRGERPLSLPDGEPRGFLEDGDEVVLTGRCGGYGFGEVRGRVEAA
jgi:fumarylacetoacetase